MTHKDTIIKKYPELFRDCYDFSIGDGWMKIVSVLCRDIEKIRLTLPKKDAKEIYVKQVKEKFGSLRFYIGGGNDVMHNLIWNAENECARTCEDCGKPGEINRNKDGWLRCLCPVCRKKK